MISSRVRERRALLSFSDRNEDKKMNNCKKKSAKSVAFFMMILLVFLSAFMIIFPAAAETTDDPEDLFSCEDIDETDWGDAYVILEDPRFFMVDAEEDVFPVISSVGKSNVKINGVKSRGKLLKYTIPEQLLRDDPDFLAMMIEAEKYIGYPYVYGASNPDTGFDCSGFVCWVLNHSGVYKTKRVGANGLYALCTDIPKEEAKPGDLVFFEKTIGNDVKGITHVGIYVGNHMMIHAGDPVGFADLKNKQWSQKIVGYGRLIND